MSDKENHREYTNFGFRKVDINDKKKLVGDVFSNIATKYDVMNDLMSLGIHRLWKSHFCSKVLDLNASILDVAGGSGDISFRIKENARNSNKEPNITICDINQEMLEVARNKAVDKNILNKIQYVCADAENLPFPDNSFDYYLIAFGIRNVSRIGVALKEARRVLKPTGKFLCLEFSTVENSALKHLYDLYSFNVIPKIGRIVSGDESAYQYLAESISLFPNQEDFKVMIKDAGFNRVNYQNLTFGVAAIHSAYKI